MNSGLSEICRPNTSSWFDFEWPVSFYISYGSSFFNIYLILYNDIVIKFDLFAYDSWMSDGNYPSNRMHEFIYTCTCNVHNIVLF